MKGLYKIILKKDLKVVFSNKMIWIPMTIVPVVFVIFFPVLFFVLAGLPEGTDDLSEFSAMLGPDVAVMNPSQMMIYFAFNYMMPTFFLLIPILSSSVIAGSSFVGEKEHKTIETLLYSPIKIRDLFLAKVFGSFIPSYGVTLISFVLFSIVTLIGQSFYFENGFFPNLKWLVLILWVSPAVSILAVLLMVISSAKSKNFQEAQQKIVFIILPVILLTVGQATGLFALNTLILLILGFVLFVINYILLTAASNSFVPEKLIN